MYLCENCKKSQDEICPYFLEHFLEDGSGAVKKCPEYEEEQTERAGKTCPFDDMERE